MLIRALFRNEIGSLQEGPAIDSPAPDFRLQTQDGSGKSTWRTASMEPSPRCLSSATSLAGPSGLVIPPSMKCAACGRTTRLSRASTFAKPIRAMVGRWNRTPAWASTLCNPPTTKSKAVAQTCATTLKWSMPLVVDGIDDPVGSTYSGMPARLYVIDSQGKVAYKSGRGPFGFKSGEMEQAARDVAFGNGPSRIEVGIEYA